MLSHICQLLRGKRVILASGSPRRRQILENIGFPFEVVPSDFEEDLNKVNFKENWECAVYNAVGKAKEVAQRLKEEEDWAVVVGADTIVISNDRILGKPGSSQRAKEMLFMLNGSTHQVCTGVAIVRKTGRSAEFKVNSFHEVTDVTFSQVDEEILESYVKSGEPLDKAGAYPSLCEMCIANMMVCCFLASYPEKGKGSGYEASCFLDWWCRYGIQGLGGTLVEGIHGDYFNVVGLPLHRLCKTLLETLGDDKE